MILASALIAPAELAIMVEHGDVRVLDASYGLPPSPDGIPGAVDFDIDDIADPDAPLAHTVPSAQVFSAKVGALGVGSGDPVVVYDRAGIYIAASRAWWMFRLFGHDNVRVLDGGLPAWIAAGLPLMPKSPAPRARTFSAAFRPELFKSRAQMLQNIETCAFAVLDARDAARFRGAAPEPRPGMSAGRIPGSGNLPFTTLIDRATGRLLPRSTLAAALSSFAGGPAACTCGSGVTACVVALALHEIGRGDAAVYGGSWAEWGADPELPKETA